ncbi:alpha/beta hydrolase [Fulvivirga maritima]|uniref:alpha/beta fold hydrolase n=1 Tax=Fulvivirga maritima TaxID=2904247 RepID=UPI001F4656CC|nr:alpha/beta hydrolase [Fulvivirga maritima]UII29125.1 alpha/beta hydrolase [Fulvivirga maritima]
MPKDKFIILILFFLCTISVKAQFSKCTDCDEFKEFKSSLCTIEKVPLNYLSNNNDSIELFVRKFPSLKNRKGSIWLIAGGPGESGASLYPLVELFSKTFPHLDIFIPDHRGTGLSSKICPKEESVDSPNGIALANDEWGPCFNHMYTNTSYVQAFSITNAARDLSLLINNFSGTGKRYVYGVSYGTQLVLRLLQLETTELDGVILDSLVPLQDDEENDLSHRSFIVNDIGNSVLTYYDTIINDDEAPLATRLKRIIQKAKNDEDFSKSLPKQDLSIILGRLLDVPKTRQQIPEIIKGLEKENFDPLNNAIKELTEFYSNYGRYETSSNSIPLVQIISASENNLRPQLKKTEVIAESEALLFSSPLAGLLAENSMPTYPRDNYFTGIPKQMPPTLILHGTLDPKTHITGAIKHYKKLPKENAVTFLKIKDAPHFIALFAPDSFKALAFKFINGEKIENDLINDKDTELK